MAEKVRTTVYIRKDLKHLLEIHDVNVSQLVESAAITLANGIAELEQLRRRRDRLAAELAALNARIQLMEAAHERKKKKESLLAIKLAEFREYYRSRTRKGKEWPERERWIAESAAKFDITPQEFERLMEGDDERG